MGVGAVFLAMIAKEEMEEIYAGSEEEPVTILLIKPVVLFIVLSSTLVHGTTIPLFKIGKRIRTRTLSIASTGSGQVLRLPKLQFGQQINMRRTEEEQQQHDEAMSQLKRNTLMNTIQHDPHQHTINMNDDDNDDGFNDEDFLPDESDETEVGYDDMSKRSDNNSPPATTKQNHHLPAAATQESQSIRFLEPVNPRAGSGNNLQVSNAERNEASISSSRSWKNRNKDNNHEAEDHAIVASSPAPQHTGLRNLFRRHHKDGIEENVEEGQPTPTGTPPIHVTSPEEKDKIPVERRAEAENRPLTHEILRNIYNSLHSKDEVQHDEIIDIGPDSLSSRIEVWDEPHHIVIEDKLDASSQTVIDKSESNWQHQVKDKIKELQTNINQAPAVDEKH